MTPLGELIRARRAALKMTQAELARRLGVHASYLSTIEHGAKAPRNNAFLNAIASCLQFTQGETEEFFAVARLSKRKVNLPPGLPAVGYELTEALMRALVSLDSEELQDLVSLVEVAIRGGERRRRATSSCAHLEKKENPM